MKIAIVGLGKLGAPMAAVLASAGHQVTGYDLDEGTVTAIRNGKASVDETGLQSTIDASEGRLTATTNLSEALKDASLSIVIVPTPSREDGGFDATYAVEAVTQIGECLRGSNTDHVISLASTVLPGTTCGEIRQALEKSCGQSLSSSDCNIGLCYNPAFIALGSVIHNLRNPDLVLIGGEDRHTAEVVENAWRAVWENEPTVAHLATIDAELAKISVNSFVTMKISFANTIAELCENMPGADAAAVLSAIGHDSRIGRKYLMPGLGFGGPCFPRDNYAFSRFAQDVGQTAPLANATDKVNKRQVERILKRIKASLPQGKSIAVLGLSYKPGTSVILESQAVDLAEDLAAAGYETRVWDPAALDNARQTLTAEVIFSQSLEAATDNVNAVIVATPWPEIVHFVNALSGQEAAPELIVDLWHCIDVKDGQQLITIGMP